MRPWLLGEFPAEHVAEGADEPIFSAWSKAAEYRLPEVLYRSHFTAGGRYRWKVSAFNADENVAGTSAASSFSFGGP